MYFFEFLYLEIVKNIGHVEGIGMIIKFNKQNCKIMEITLQQSLQVFYDDNNFGEEGGIKEDWVWIKFGFVSFPMPNFEQRKKNVWRHDANHILLGYDTSWKGESAVSAWEIGSQGNLLCSGTLCA